MRAEALPPGFETTHGPGGLRVDALGAGPPIVFVSEHGARGAAVWRAQWPLAARWRLSFPYQPSADGPPPASLESLALTAQALAELLDEGAHLVGQGEGGLLALLAAALRPRAVWSLLAIEPPALRAAPDDPEVDRYEKAQRALFEASGRNDQPLWDHEIPTDVLMAATFPKLFVSGGHHPALETICDTLALQLGGDRKLLPGAGTALHTLGQGFNAVLEAFWLAQPLP